MTKCRCGAEEGKRTNLVGRGSWAGGGGEQDKRREGNCGGRRRGQHRCSARVIACAGRAQDQGCCLFDIREKRIAALYRQALPAGDRPLKEEDHPAQVDSRSVIKYIMCQTNDIPRSQSAPSETRTERKVILPG